MKSPVGRRNEKAFAAVAFALVVAASYLLTRLFSARAAYIHLGAIFGTIMAANVWMHILPAQRRMVEALKEGRKPDETHGARAKLRSKHNTFMAVPVVFTMISHHFTSAYGHEYNWVIFPHSSCVWSRRNSSGANGGFLGGGKQEKRMWRFTRYPADPSTSVSSCSA